MKQTFSVLVENRAGVLSHISGLFSSRGFNIESLAVGETEEPAVSRMTIVASGDERTMEQIKKQLNKLVNVIKVQELTSENSVDRELLLIKVASKPAQRGEIFQIVEVFRGNVVDITPKSMTIELTGDTEKIAGFIDLLYPFGIKELVRTGKIAISREPKK